MTYTNSLRPVRLAAACLVVGLIVLLAAHGSRQVTAAPTAALTIAAVNQTDVNCLFDTDCTIFVDDIASGFVLDSMTGSGFLQSRLWPRGEAGTTGVGLFTYLYRLNLQELVGPGNPGCVTSFSFDFGPVVPLDYDDDGSLEDVFVVTSGAVGSVAPSAVDLTGGKLTVSFSPAICGDFSAAQNNGQSSFFIGLASPFREREVAAEVNHNWGSEPLALTVRAPQGISAPSLSVVPSSGSAGDTVQLIGSGYTPGSYAGTIRWDGSSVDTFTIPSGGAFSQPFTIPTSASQGDHTVTVCSLNPCATGEFEQLASAPFAVTSLYLPNQLFLPLVTKPGLAAAEPFSYVIDSSVTPAQAELPGLDGGTPRPLTAVRDPHGNVSTFVANELVIQTNSSAALSGFLSRTGGTVLLTIDPTTAGVTGVPTTYLVRANLNQADLSSLSSNLEALKDADIESIGRFAFADNDGPRILALAAEEAASGLTVGVNWVSDTLAIPTNSDEAPNGMSSGGVTYTPDAYSWAHFARGTVQDIGVPEAWTLMSRAGRLVNKVDLAILDGGFFPNSDFPSGVTYISVIPFITDPRNVSGVDGSAPFHGTDVLQTAVARSDNDLGIVGVAAPVARPIAVFTSYDYVVSIAAVISARAAGADIINMSYSANVPSIFGFTIWPFEATTAAVSASGALLFASAGNDGQNVDGEDCFIVCWEHTWHTPCENAGVICVGGLGWNSDRKAGNSNFGPEHVDIYAPYTVYSGQSPAAPGGDTSAGFINGTSFSSPYAASVAALIWASDPSQSANEVWTTLRDTAHTSPDSRVNRYVNAYQAVLNTIGVGVDATLTAPASGATYPLGLPVRLSASVGYVATTSGTPVQIEWRVDGALVNSVTYTPGSGSHLLYPEAHVHDLTVGSHTALLRVTAGSVVVEKSVTFTISNTPPTASIDQPANNATFCAGETVTLRGSAFDPNQPFGLPDSAYAWSSSVNGSLGTGATRTTSSLTAGSHVITLRVTDNQLAWDEDTINLMILSMAHPDCVDLDPTAVITSPANNAGFDADTFNGTHWYKQITFNGTVGDTEDLIGDLTVEWISNRQGSLGTATVNPSTGFTSITSNILVLDSCGSTHVITLRVTDSAGNVTEDQITIFVSLLC